jgi:N-acetylmuramoyl-L-alanine amidase
MKKSLIATAVLSMGVLLGATPSFAYTVKSGDTLGNIAKNHNMPLETVIKLNPQIKNPNLIYVGDNVNTSHNNTNTVSTNVTPEVNTEVNSADVDLLARLIEAEAKGEPYAGKVAVGYVVMNRIDSEGFPNTLKGVIYQSGQFTPVSNGAINSPASADSVKAAKEAMSADRSKGAGSLFFYNAKTASSRWLDSRPTTLVIGNHTFKK